MTPVPSYRYIVTCAKGSAPYVSAEIQELGYTAAERSATAVEVYGDAHALYRLNLWLRCAHRVLLFLWEGEAATAADLYQWAVGLSWESHIDPTSVITVTASVRNQTIRNSLYACQKLKDAIADRMRRYCGRRPNSNSSRQGTVIFLHWRDNHVSVWLDSSGIPLSKRGYRQHTTRAPLSEALAATIMRASGWNPSVPLIVPMCGSGTFAIEAAMMARNIAPALYRPSFAFQWWRGFQVDVWNTLREEARSMCIETKTVILACDNERAALNSARANAQAAHVERSIEFRFCDFRCLTLPPPPAFVIANPPYGIRIGEESDLPALYRELGDWLKHSCAGMKGFILTTPDNAKFIGLRPKRRVQLFNADIECRLLEYELYRGTKKTIPRNTDELD
ncbi:MAG: class I SAM-dependent RNA methyltransferase [Chlorobi bacterium]|nr:class I SAM-dependent RNA methyltransferase [Chlorobiota bacterium]